MKEKLCVLVHTLEEYKKFIKEMQKNYNRRCEDDQYGYISKENRLPSMFRLNTKSSMVDHNPLMTLSENRLHAYKPWTDNLISVDDFINLNKKTYTVRVEFTRTLTEFGEIKVKAKSETEARRIARDGADEISESDMWEGDDSNIAVNHVYDDWDIEPAEEKDK